MKDVDGRTSPIRPPNQTGSFGGQDQTWESCAQETAMRSSSWEDPRVREAEEQGTFRALARLTAKVLCPAETRQDLHRRTQDSQPVSRRESSTARTVRPGQGDTLPAQGQMTLEQAGAQEEREEEGGCYGLDRNGPSLNLGCSGLAPESRLDDGDVILTLEN